MSNMVDDIAGEYAEAISNIIDQHAKNFLEKNNIPFTNIEETQALLRQKGYRLIDEQEGGLFEDRKHTLLLVKIIDQTSYVIKAPQTKLEGED